VGVGIEVINLNAWYGSNHTLQDINLHIPANHATALIGPSGCGKSTFVRCLNRMHETNPIARATGTVRMGDVDIYKDASPVVIRRRVGMVFQRPNPFPTMSIYDNVISGLKLNGFSNRRVLDETVERSLKAASRYARIRAALECERRVPAILYLCSGKDLMLALIYHLTPLAKPVAFATARAFLENLLATAVMTGADGGLQTLDTFLVSSSPVAPRSEMRAWQ